MSQLDVLSDREREVVDLLLEGNSNKAMAAALHISERTVEFHLKNIYDKFDVRSRVELVLKLGNSTVVDKGEVAENEDGPDSRNWATSLQEAVSLFGKELETKMTDTFKSDVQDEDRSMTFFQAILTCLLKSGTFHGRASRSEFWWFTLFLFLLVTALSYLSEAVAGAFLVVMLLPWLAAGTRRLNDAGMSGWWQLFLLVPVGGIVIVGSLWARPSA
ncbi:MAG: DUF805 domain-containing protein [Chloroflexi bacterium]|nr:DUF805 domain-containing protein [Ardenticatenaceae bacterium]MBL1127397.1 DUF805 domain-containing protein [Chloroflexota bacterium]NOG33459.1 DUF805 domain-containing protein [Chloroflexota bacterium]GIK58530.1 MAG: hypothetical protein BroJett015_41930 [Chloroflexota bacterium]